MPRPRTVDDIVRALDEEPELREALRDRILPRELLELHEKLALLADRVEPLAERLDRMEEALEVLKGAHARNVAERDVGLIARSLGLRDPRVLSAADLFDLAAGAGADMSSSTVQSYVQADLVFEAADAGGETCYAAVEVSYTANGADTGRALRNSVFLIRFTGCPCQPVVASLHVDDCVSDLVKSGRILWYRMAREAPEAA